jgi:hypothetical protein
MNDRATYATTGTRIYVDFSSDGHPMGSQYESRAKPRFSVRVAGTNTISLVEIVKLADGQYSTVLAVRPGAETFVTEFTDEAFAAPSMYYLRIRQVDEYADRLYAHSTAEMAWSSPIWIDRR